MATLKEFVETVALGPTAEHLVTPDNKGASFPTLEKTVDK